MRKICVLLILGLLASVAHASNGPYTWEYNMSTDPVGDGWFVRTPGVSDNYNMTDVPGMMHMTGGEVTLDPVVKNGTWLDTNIKYTMKTDGIQTSGPAPWLDIECNRGMGVVMPIVRSVAWIRVHRDPTAGAGPTSQGVQISRGFNTAPFQDVNGFGLGMLDVEVLWHTFTGAPIHGIDTATGYEVGGKFDYTITDGTITKSGYDVNYMISTNGVAPNMPTIWNGQALFPGSGYLDHYYVQVGPPIPPEEVGISIENDGPTVTVKYDASTASKKVRGFALDVSLSGGATFASNPTNYNSGFPLAPGSMTIVGGSITNNGNHLTSGGSGTSAAVIEMASLTPSAGDSGTLFEFDVSGSCNVTIGENMAAGGITLEDHTLDVNLTAPVTAVDATCTGYKHFPDGDNAGSPLPPPAGSGGMPDGAVDSWDLNNVININNWNKNTTDASTVWPGKANGTANRCADMTGSPLPFPAGSGGGRDGTVDSWDLNLVINVNNWGCPGSTGCTWP